MASNEATEEVTISTEDFLDEKERKRYVSIDIFRGLIIVGMVFVNIMLEFDSTPSWLKHEIDFGLQFADLIAPFFIFAITLTYTMSFKHHVKREGYFQTYLRFLRRYGAFLGFGFLGSYYPISSEGLGFTWGVLQAIGLAGIFTLFLIRFPRYIRLVVSIGLIVAYQAILGVSVNVEGTPITLSELNLNDSHGGIIGGIGYCIMTLLGTAIVDDFKEVDKKQILIAGIILTSLGLGIHFIWRDYGFPPDGGISKERVTSAFILLSLGLGAILFWFIWFFMDEKKIIKIKSRIFQPLGKNAFLIYILHPLFILLTTLILPIDAHFALIILCTLLSCAILWLLAFFLDRKQIYVII